MEGHADIYDDLWPAVGEQRDAFIAMALFRLA
jgi:hypothetical protein